MWAIARACYRVELASSDMNKFVWLNREHPQTLQIFVMITYFRAIFAIVLSGISPYLKFIGNAGRLPWYATLFFILGFAGIVGAIAVANNRLWGYILSIINAFFPFAIAIFFVIFYHLSFFGYIKSLISPDALIETIFQIAIIALLLHPESRNFVKRRFTKSFP